MKLKDSEIDFIQTTVQTAQLVDIDSIIIEPGKVRGVDDNRSVVIFQEGIPDMSFGSIGLNRVDTFLSRLDVILGAKTQPTIEAQIDKDYVRSLIMKTKGTKIDYRCAAPATIQAPTHIHDEIVTDITVPPEAITMLAKGLTAMGNTENLTIISNDKEVRFCLTDINQDEFNHKFSDSIDYTFSYKYPVKYVLTLLKKHPDGIFSVGEKGILKFELNGLGLYLMPRV